MSYVDVELSSLPARINLYLNSVNRTLGDSPSSFEMTLANTLVTADTNEIFFMNVIQFNTFNNFYQVQTGYNTDFSIILKPISGNNQTIKGTKPYGNLTVLDVLNYLQTLLNGLVNVTYDKLKNKFLFTRTIDTTTLYNGIYISNIYLNIINCDLLLGYSRKSRNINIEFVYNVPKYSDQPVNVISITNFFIHVAGDLYLNDENYDNHNSSEVDNNNIIFSMAIDKPFNSCLSYNNIDAGNSFFFRLDNAKTNINNFRLEIRDQFNVLIPNFPEYNMIIQFTKKTRENVFLGPLLEIKNYILQLYLMIGIIFQKLKA
jgi:hypothetical protein